MLQTLQDIFFFCSAWIVFVPFILAIVLFKRFTAAYRVLSIHIFIACAVELASYLMSLYRQPNLFLLHIYTLTEFLLLYLFYEIYFNRFYPVWPLRITAAAFLVFSVINSLFIQPVTGFNSYARAAEAFIMTVLSLLCFYKLAQEHKPAVTWINTGLLLYFSGSFLLFIVSNYILSYSSKLNYHIWAVHAFLSLLLYLLITIGLWKARKN
jgi:hypothetical protein